MPSGHLELSWGSIWRVLLLGVGAVVVYFTLDIWIMVFLGIVISSGLNPLVNLLERARIPRVLGAIIGFLIVITVFGTILAVVIPEVVRQAQVLIERYFDFLAPRFGIDTSVRTSITQIILERLNTFTSLGAGAAGSFFQISKDLVNNFALAISAIAIAFYLTIDNRGIEKFIKAMLPAPSESKVNEIILRARRKIGYWVQAQIGLSFFVGALTFVGLFTLGWFTGAEVLMANALVLGLLAAVFEIIPFVGPFFSGAMAMIIALSALVPNPLLLALYVVILFVIIQQIEGDFLIPTLMNRAIGLHPVAVLVSLLVGAKLFGFIGLLLAVPASVVIQEFVEDWSSKRAKHSRLV